MDTLFVLDQLPLDQADLAEVIDTSTVGVAGFSAGGYTAVAVNGAQIDPEYFLDWYETDKNDPTVLDRDLWVQPWDDIVAYRTQLDPPLVEGELWPPFSDERIRAVVSIAPCYGPLFGESGLAAAHVPTLLMGATIASRSLGVGRRGYRGVIFRAHRVALSSQCNLRL